MPLIYNKTKVAFEKNIARLIKDGYPRKQAVAIAKKIKRGYKPKRKK